MKRTQMTALLAAGCMVLGSAAAVSAQEARPGVSIFVQGYEWGPGVPKVIVELEQEVREVTAEQCAVTTAGQERTVTEVYVCDVNGEKSDEASKYAVFELVTTAEQSGSPFTYNRQVMMNQWTKTYPVTVDCAEFTADGTVMPLAVDADCIGSRICPDTERFRSRASFTGTYRNQYTLEDEEITLRTAAYEPETLAGGEKNPLIIWLHGQGEGGTDPDIALLGNEVCALAREEIQSFFTAGEQTGAYVLAVQCETYWMDEGDGTNGNGSGVSRYTEALMDTIQAYVEQTPDVDPKRIYLGGCSNGGYMTLNMLVTYPDYFAAAYPCCEAYSFYGYERSEDGSYKIKEGGMGTSRFYPTGERWLTEEKVEAIKDIPMWLILSADDFVVNPKAYTLPSYRALIQAGAENCWLSVFETVAGTDSPGSTYIGHFAWVYLFNNQVTGVQDRETVAASADEETFGTMPTNQGGGTQKAGAYDNLFAWLNAQSN